jgi:hypothetical protein
MRRHFAGWRGYRSGGLRRPIAGFGFGKLHRDGCTPRSEPEPGKRLKTDAATTSEAYLH